VNKIYNSSEVKVHAVNDVTLDFSEAEFAAIVGPSGSGKTTLLNLIGGLDMPTSGEIIIGGTNLSKLKSSQLIDFRLNNIGFVFQSYNLIPVLTAKENVEFIMTLQKWPVKKRDERTIELLKAVGLGDRINSGQQNYQADNSNRLPWQEPLCQEIYSGRRTYRNLDSKAATTLLGIMEKLNHESKITFIFSTHDPRVVKMAHRVITLEDGKVISDDIRELPA
jgi:putative ABC transport system ATP-binding protein